MSRLSYLLALVLLPVLSHAAEPLNPDQLLQRIRSERAAEVSAMRGARAGVRQRSQRAGAAAGARQGRA